MSTEDNQGQLASLRFATELRRQFEDLAERNPEPHGRRRVVVAAAVAVVAVAIAIGGVAVAGGFDRSRAPAASPHRSILSRQAGQAGGPGRFFKMPDPLHDPSVKGVSLASAFARIGKPLSLPPAKSSDVVKVLFTRYTKKQFQLTILYASGIVLNVSSGSANSAGWVARGAAGTGPKYDDGKQHSKLATVAGKEVLTVAGGMQDSGGWRAPTFVEWNQGGCVYTLFDETAGVTTKAADAAISRLLVLVAETK